MSRLRRKPPLGSLIPAVEGLVKSSEVRPHETFVKSMAPSQTFWQSMWKSSTTKLLACALELSAVFSTE